MVTHRLILIRHGEAQPMARTDRQRELTTRGRAGAQQAGEWLATMGAEPGHALVSSATRTVSTWRDVCAGAGWSGSQAQVLDEVYDAGAGALFALIGATDESLQSLVVVGHNPAIASLAFGLDDLQAEAGLTAARDFGVEPGTVVVFDVPCPWAELEPRAARVIGSFRLTR